MVLKNSSTLQRMVLFFLILPLLALACNFPMVAVQPSNKPAESTLIPMVALDTEVAVPSVEDEKNVLVNLYAQVNPAVVNITIYASNGNTIVPVGQGSGWLYDNARHLVTNAHVVNNAEQVEITFSGGTISSAEVIGVDLESDLALLQAEYVPADVEPLPLGDMSQLAVGQTVVAIGNPFGLNGTLTQGIISALGRDIPALTQFKIPQSIQTDAAINPGNSGGPLLNLQGQVIGVNAQIETSSMLTVNSGVGFAIPISIVKRVIPDLVADGYTQWAYLGVRGGSLHPTLVKAMELSVEQGAYLAEIVENGAASEAGLQGSNGTVIVDGREVDVGGDVIIAIDGQPVMNFDDLLIYIALETRPGQEVTLTIIRDDRSQDVKVILGARPSS